MKKETLQKRTKIANDIMYYIYTHIETNIDIEELSIDLGISKFHMHRIFKEAFGKNIYESIKSIRLQKASNLLLTNKYSTISNIVNQCEMNPNLTDIIKKIAIAKNQVRHQHTLKCGKCEKEYIINVTDYIFNKKEYNKFCSRSCANSRVKTEEIKNKTSEKLKTYYELNPVVKKEKTLKNKEVKCKTCNTVFIVDSKSRIRYCSNQCITYKNYKRSKN